MKKTPNSARRLPIPIIAIGLMIILPYVLAVTVYHLRPARWLAREQHGQLLTPPLSLSSLAFETRDGQPLPTRGQWTVIYNLPGPCKASCQRTMDALGRIRRRLGAHAGRVHWVLASQKVTPPIQRVHLKEGVYFSDPYGNIMLFFAPSAKPMGIYRDLKKTTEGISNWINARTHRNAFTPASP